MGAAKLNPAQADAVEHGDGPMLVVAGAGSGKTRVITHRIASLVGRGVHPGRIAAMTFTNKAANEMRHRVGALLGKGPTAALSVGTFHALGLVILRTEREAVGLPHGFAVYDTADQMGVLREIMRTISDGDRRFDVKAILARISRAKNKFILPEQYVINECDEYDDITSHVYPRYQEALRAFGALDFDDLIVRVLELFEKRSDVAARWRGQFQHVLVDEYQDTNKAQLLFLKNLTHTHGNVCAVGDDDQSIYSWRGAEPSQMYNFEKDFPGAKVVVLDQNYRSTSPILSVANVVIHNNHKRRPKELWSARSEGPLPILVAANDPEQEAKFVAREIHKLVKEEGLAYKDFAILYRSNILSKELEEALRVLDIPHVVLGGQQFFERKEVKDLLAYLRFFLNQRDEIALRRIINYPARGIGASTIQRIEEESKAKKAPFWQVMSQLPDVPPRTQAALDGFVGLSLEIREQMQTQGVAAAARTLISSIGLYDDIRAGSPTGNAAARRIENVESLLRSINTYESKGKNQKDVAQFIRQLSLNTSDDEEGDNPSDNKVTLCTLHGAKGLEFRRVFFIGLEEGILPHARTLMPKATDITDPDHATDIEEERRLAYVGITRAIDVLYMSRCAYRIYRGKAEERTPSRFLMEVPAPMIQTRDLVVEDETPVAAADISNFFAQFLD